MVNDWDMDAKSTPLITKALGRGLGSACGVDENGVGDAGATVSVAEDVGSGALVDIGIGVDVAASCAGDEAPVWLSAGIGVRVGPVVNVGAVDMVHDGVGAKAIGSFPGWRVLKANPTARAAMKTPTRTHARLRITPPSDGLALARSGMHRFCGSAACLDLLV